MCSRQRRLHRIIGLTLSLISFAFSSPGQNETLASRVAPPQSKSLTWNTLYIVGPGVGGTYNIPARLTAIDLTTRREIFLGSTASDAKLSANGSLLYVASIFPRSHLSAVDTATKKDLWSVSLKEMSGYTGIGTDFGASPDDRFVYIPAYFVGNDIRPPRLRVIDVMRRVELPDTIQLPVLCQGVGDVVTPATGNFVYLHCQNKLILINTTTQTIQHSLTIEEPVRALMFSPDGQWLYLFVGNNGLGIFDPAQRRVVRRISFEPNRLLQNPQSLNIGVLLARSADGKRLLVAQSLYERKSETELKPATCLFRVFDTRTWQNVAAFKFSHPVYTVAMNAKGDAIYAAIATRSAAKVEQEFAPNTVVELSAASGRIRRQFVRKNEYITRVFLGP